MDSNLNFITAPNITMLVISINKYKVLLEKIFCYSQQKSIQDKTATIQMFGMVILDYHVLFPLKYYARIKYIPS